LVSGSQIASVAETAQQKEIESYEVNSELSKAFSPQKRMGLIDGSFE